MTVHFPPDAGDDARRNVVVIACSPLPPYIPLSVSDNASRLLGCKPGAFIGNPNFLTGLVHIEDMLQLLSGFFHLYLRGLHLSDYRVLTGDGTYERMLVEIQLVRDKAGKPNSIVMFLARPSIRKDLDRGGGAVNASLPRDNRGFDVTVDDHYCIRTASRSVENILDYTPRMVVGKRLYDYIPSDYQPMANAAIIRILECCKDDVALWLAFHHRDGSIRYLAIEAQGVNSSRERMIAAACRDITPLVEARRNFVERTADLPVLVDRRAPEEDDLPATADLTRLLTGREREILALIARGRANKEIADQLSISARTVEAHRSAVMRKLRIKTHAGLIHYATQKNILTGK